MRKRRVFVVVQMSLRGYFEKHHFLGDNCRGYFY